jgi:pectate lyase
MFDRRRRIALYSAATAAVTLAAAGMVTAVTTAAYAATACQVNYSVSAQWPGGFTGNVTINNIGDPLNGWTLAWTFPAGQTVQQSWGARIPVGTSSISAANESYNGSVATGASVSFGFNGSWNNSSNPAPTSFSLNGTVCNGGTPPTSTSRPPTTTSRPPTTTSRPPTTTSRPPTTTSNPQPPGGLVGWGTQGGGTTGGGNASPTTVTSASALTSALSASGTAVIRVSGTISCSGMLRVASNKSILGNSGATIAGCGLNISEASNVIVRNITFRDWNDDAINVQYSTRVWIDHNSFTNGNDGAVDIKRSSDYITVSWNRVFGHDKSMLLGHSDDNASEDRGRLRVTYHHNWFDGSNQRHPRVRFGSPVHVYNNYYNNVGGYGVASTLEGCVIVEGNYFENTDDPYHRGEGDSPPSNLVARNNTFVNSGTGDAGGSCPSVPYSFSLEASGNVRASVMASAGAGRISV